MIISGKFCADQILFWQQNFTSEFSELSTGQKAELKCKSYQSDEQSLSTLLQLERVSWIKLSDETNTI